MDWLLTVSAARPAEAAAGAVPFLKLAGTVLGGWLLSRGAEAAVAQRAAGSAETDFLNAKVLTCRHFMAHVMVDAASLSRTVLHGADTTLAQFDFLGSSVSGNAWVGGLVGQSTGTATFSGVVSSAAVTTNRSTTSGAGGMAGYVAGAVTNATATGNVLVSSIKAST